MTAEEATARADDWARARYGAVPPALAATLYDDALRRRLELGWGHAPPPGERGAVRGRWLVSYFCSWDADAPGLPPALHVLVDDATGAAERCDG